MGSMVSNKQQHKKEGRNWFLDTKQEANIRVSASKLNLNKPS